MIIRLSEIYFYGKRKMFLLKSIRLYIIIKIKDWNVPKIKGGENMNYGYARVSTTKQGYGNSLEEQLLQLFEAGCDEVIEEKFSAKTNDRPQLKILLEKLKVTSEIERKYNRLNYVFSKLFNVDVSEVVEEYLGFNSGWIRKIDIYNYFKKNPEDVDFFREITEIAKECHELGISSLDFYNWKNLGYKKDGKLGFFDIGFGDGFLVPNNLQNIEIDEVFGGSSLYSTTNTVSDDNKPTYNQIDSSDPIDNNIIRNTNELSERQISAMKDSSSVEVKKKCKLGGLGNKSIACNQGDINNLIIKPIEEIFYRFSNNINEEIDASEAYDVEGAIMTIINGKRNVGLVSFHKNQNLKNFVINSGLNIIPVKQEQQNANTSIIYCDGYEKQANMLHDIMKSHGGYLSDKTPKEAYIIGRLLGYTNDSILRYIYKKYPHIRKDYSQRYSGSTMNENLTDSKILVPIRDHVGWITPDGKFIDCLLYTSDAADDLLCVDLGCRRIIKKKK